VVRTAERTVDGDGRQHFSLDIVCFIAYQYVVVVLPPAKPSQMRQAKAKEPFMTTKIMLVAALLASAISLSAFAADDKPAPATQPTTQPGKLTAEQIDNLAAPIALFPDTIVTQILYAATNPSDVATAQKWLTDHPKATAAEIDSQKWHPSVIALAKLPTILKTMSDSMDWTRAIGGAFVAQQKDVMASIARLRANAQAVAGQQPMGQQPASPQPLAQQVPQQQQPVPQQADAVVQQPVVVQQSTPVYVPPTVYSSYSTSYGYPAFGYPYDYTVGSPVVVVGGGVVGGPTVYRQGVTGGIVGPIPPPTNSFTGPGVYNGVPPTRPNGLSTVTSTSQASFGYAPSAGNGRRSAVSPSIAPTALSNGPQVTPPNTIVAPPVRAGGR